MKTPMNYTQTPSVMNHSLNMRKNFAFRWSIIAFAVVLTLSLGCTATHSVSPVLLSAETSLQAARNRQSVPAQKERNAKRFPRSPGLPASNACAPNASRAVAAN